MGGRFEPRAVVFDMDGLMFDSEREVQYAWDVTGEELGYGKLGHNIYHTLGMDRQGRERYFKERYGDDFPVERFQQRYREVAIAYARKRGIVAKPGLYELLEAVRARGIPAAVATSSSREHAYRNLEGSRTLPYFQAVICGNMVTEAKPSPQIYLRACEALGVRPQEAAALEDSYNGLRAAAAAGMKAIMVPDLQTDDAPVRDILYARVKSLLDVIELFGWTEKDGAAKERRVRKQPDPKGSEDERQLEERRTAGEEKRQ